MIRKALRYLGIGIILMAAALFTVEFIASGYEFPPVTGTQWAILFAGIIMIGLSTDPTRVVDQHLPH